MDKKLKIVKNLKVWLIVLVTLLSILLVSTTTLAYFNYIKVYEEQGYLPKLNISYTISGNNPESLRNIYYSGQDAENITVKLTSYGNNISGYVRVKVAISWSNSLNNTPYNDNNQIVTACDISNYEISNRNKWEKRNGFYYLKEPMAKDSEVVLFDQIVFGEYLSSYVGERVSIYIIAEIYQTTNLPENW